jgi:hypothetical protein
MKEAEPASTSKIRSVKKTTKEHEKNRIRTKEAEPSSTSKIRSVKNSTKEHEKKQDPLRSAMWD